VSTEMWRRGTIASAVGIVILLVIALVAGINLTKSDNSSASTPTARTASAPVSGTGSTASTCWPVKLDDNVGYRVLSAGVPAKYRKSANSTTNYLLKAARQDPRALMAFWNATPRGAKDPVRDWHELVDNKTGTCYSVRGQSVWQELAAQLRLSQVRKSVAPRHGCNFYVKPGGNAGCVVEVIRGNRHGVKITFVGGKSIWVMFRCSNPVTKAPPPGNHPPKVPHRHAPPHKAPPHHVCQLKARPGYSVNEKTCTLFKPKQSFQCMQNGGPKCPPNHVIQPVQHEGPGQHTAHQPTPGAPKTAPTPNPIGPKPQSGTPAPPPTPGGYNSGSGDGSGTPGGSTCDSSGCTGGGATPGSGPVDTTNSGDNNGTDGSGNSTGTGGGVVDPG